MSKLKKWFSPTPIWGNPIGWARNVGQSRAKVIFWILIHIAFVGGGLWAIYSFTGKIQSADFPDHSIRNQLQMLAILSGAMPIFFIGVCYPAFYLYVIYRLLQEIDKQDKVGRQSRSFE